MLCSLKLGHQSQMDPRGYSLTEEVRKIEKQVLLRHIWESIENSIDDLIYKVKLTDQRTNVWILRGGGKDWEIGD